MKMSKEAIRKFLEEKRVGVLGINRKTEAPQLVPIWYLYDGEVIWLMSEKEVSKITNARRDPRLALCVHDEAFPYKGVTAYGTVTLVEENVQETRRRIARRYFGEERGDAYVAEPRPKGTIILKLVPERFYSFDNGRGGRD